MLDMRQDIGGLPQMSTRRGSAAGSRHNRATREAASVLHQTGNLIRLSAPFGHRIFKTEPRCGNVHVASDWRARPPGSIWSDIMAKQSPRPRNLPAQTSDIGMRRFFSAKNRHRYRKLASGAIDVTERHRLLDMLAEELSAFKREAHLHAGGPLRPLAGDVASHV
jgi:hypothetical protein